MADVDFSYITPRYVEELSLSVLWRTVQEYRHAADLLRRSPSSTSQDLRTELLHAVALLEVEMERRSSTSMTDWEQPLP